MSSNSRLIFILFFIFTGCWSSKIPMTKIDNNANDALIMMALDYEIHKDYSNSAEIFAMLYQRTKKYEYLKKAITQSLVSKKFEASLKLCKISLDKFPYEKEKYYRFAVISSLQLVKLDEALRLSKILLKKYNNTINYEVIGNVYYARQEYQKAVSYFESAYAADGRPKALTSLANILYTYLDEKKKAISYLETFIRIKGCNKNVCKLLIAFYMEQQNIDGMISILKMQFKTNKNKKIAFKILNLLISSLEQKDIKDAIEFLEKNRVDDIKLLLLYERAGEYKKALILVRKIYRKTRDKSLLGKIAILEFELAKDKKKIMKHVIANFELAIKYTKNPSYKNYYGYLLIDYKINIKKGLKLVEEALKASPTNIAYMDSAAWGYYKLKKCKKAFKYIKQVTDQVGFDNEEIKFHWEKIKECQK